MRAEYQSRILTGRSGRMQRAERREGKDFQAEKLSEKKSDRQLGTAIGTCKGLKLGSMDTCVPILALSLTRDLGQTWSSLLASFPHL